ncbi:hypothetical protein IQ266_13990 [filamentous cyanobacterium LEGE 11480]|uniref:Uncharacterized protein n=1 Tax=Romeriopsis navalis LEGE 11480 TaxID=2777977 RepID=A0A928Z4A9_9CYAN|nr:hypothetical protein [Romeriopsis navalis]MBE9030842.1 hypothetical protein [Romeriopsis navalis LEGE 11480]
MFELLEDTKTYWQALNALEQAYQNGEISLVEVDAQVKKLVADLGQSRRQALRDLWGATQHFVQQHRDEILGVSGIILLSYIWLTLH